VRRSHLEVDDDAICTWFGQITAGETNNLCTSTNTSTSFFVLFYCCAVVVPSLSTNAAAIVTAAAIVAFYVPSLVLMQLSLVNCSHHCLLFSHEHLSSTAAVVASCLLQPLMPLPLASQHHRLHLSVTAAVIIAFLLPLVTSIISHLGQPSLPSLIYHHCPCCCRNHSSVDDIASCPLLPLSVICHIHC
jgi:hypothetical protein